jgi:hypothetical protein
MRSAFVKYATLVTNMNLTWQAVTSEFHPDGMKEKADSIGQAGQGLPRLNKSKIGFNPG